MNKIALAITVMCLIISTPGISQTAKPFVSSGGCDCNDAKKITVEKNTKYGPTEAPKGPGKKNEIKSIKGASPVFEKEHNIAWYLLTITFDGELGITILPSQANDDYDFVIYPYTDSLTCNKISRNQVEPIRSNLARSQNIKKGVTGLAYSSDSIFKNSGIGNSFSKSLPVKKGQKYLLALDNVYPKGSGHTLIFYSISNYSITGKAITVPKNQIVQYFILNEANDTVAIDSTKKDGTYVQNVWLNDYEKYSVVFESDSCFASCKTFSPIGMAKKGKVLINDTLYRIVKNKPIKLDNVYFAPGSAVLEPEAIPFLNNLLFMMKKYPKMSIRIEGHVNGDTTISSTMDAAYFRKLSYERAAAVSTYLVSNGIAQDRISMVGYGASKPVIKNPRNPEGMRRNMRVEIVILDY
jgi:outer membrane protein OmpA-like peptidoglycan-associated protein